jgi:endo-1,3-1,4-beta-glycanase ExoK
MLALSCASEALAQSRPAASFFEPFNTIDTRRWYISDGWINGNWQGCTWARSNLIANNGVLKLQLTKAPNKLSNYKCAEIRTLGRYGYGLYEVSLRSAAGAGLNTAMFTYSGPPLTPVHDEIDFEFLGKVPQKVQLNYYVTGKGGRETLTAVGSDASKGFHKYGFEWTPTELKWYTDGRLVRTATGGAQPKTPGQLFLSLWMGSNKTESWLGKFVDPRTLITAEVDWIAYTAPGERCKFAQSVSCNRP